MTITKEQCWALTLTLALLLITTPLLIRTLHWFFTGHVMFGVTIGLMVGMTKSAVVSAALPPLFTFAGGSIVALSIGPDIKAPQLETLGEQLVGFGVGTIVGMLTGVVLRKFEIELPLGRFQD
jgi:hypothetical protein